MSWISALLEADEVDPIIDKATNGNAMGITDVNLASTEVLGSGASTDPNALDYYKTDCFSATTDMSDVKSAGSIGADYDSDTDRSVTSGNQIKATKEGYFTPDELRGFYTEAVSEVINESKEEIDAKYKAKINAAKEWKKKALAREKKAAAKGKAAQSESAVNNLLDTIFNS